MFGGQYNSASVCTMYQTIRTRSKGPEIPRELISVSTLPVYKRTFTIQSQTNEHLRYSMMSKERRNEEL